MAVDNAEHTFVILAYRESKYLEGCIKSVLGQSVKSKVVIATSTPNSFIQALADAYHLPVKVNPCGGGIGNDWNFGLNCADTRYVTLAHQDDVYLPEFAQQCIAAANANSATGPLIVFNRPVTYKNDTALRISVKNIIRWLLIFPFHFKRCISSRAVKKFILLFSNSISCPGVLYVKQNLPGFKFNEEAKYVLDWQAWHDMARMEGSFIYAPQALHIHREHSESATSSTQLAILQQEELGLLQRMWGNNFMPRLITQLLLLAK